MKIKLKMRFLAVILAVVVLLVSVFPLCCYAATNVDNWAFRTHYYLQDYADSIDAMYSAVAQDIANGTIDATTTNGKRLLKMVALQNLASWNPIAFNVAYAVDCALNGDDSVYNSLPDDITFTGSASCGVYRSELDAKIHPVNSFSYAGNGVVCASDEFTVSMSYSDSSNTITFDTYYENAANQIYSGTYNNTASFGDVYLNFTSTGYFTSLKQFHYNYSGTGRSNYYTYISKSTSPYTLSVNSFRDGYGSVKNGVCVGSMGQDVSLPSGSTSKDSIWNYYNNTILTYINNNYADIDNYTNYILFPNGWYPRTDPTEPGYQDNDVSGNGVNAFAFCPVIIGAGAIINVDGINLDVFAPIQDFLRIDNVDLSFSADGNQIKIDGNTYNIPVSVDVGDLNLDFLSGNTFTVDGIEFNINADGTISIDGTPYTLPIGIPTTLASDAYNLVYQYEIPTIDNPNIVDATLEAPDLSLYSADISTFWAFIEKIYNGSGLMPILLITITLSAIGYGIWKIAG